MRFVEHHLQELRQRWGVHTLDLAVPTHIHDDHTAGIPHLQRRYGTRTETPVTGYTFSSITLRTTDEPVRSSRNTFPVESEPEPLRYLTSSGMSPMRP